MLPEGLNFMKLFLVDGYDMDDLDFPSGLREVS